MENKEMNKNAPVELDAETLNVVSGGASLDEIRVKCTQLGIDFDALYADLEPCNRDASIVGQLAKNAWERSMDRNWYSTTDIVSALREKYPLDR